MMLQIDFSTRINGEFKILDYLGSGFSCKVYRVQSRNGNYRAAKFVYPKYKELIEMESKAMQKYEERRSYGTPYWYYFGKHGYAYVLVMDLLGNSIWNLYRNYNGLGLKSALMIGIQLTHRIEKLHNRGFIHRDIKPDNFLIGRTGKDLEYIYLIDYGLALKYRDSSDQHKPSAKARGFYGTVPFSSAQASKSQRQSRKCDLESLLYSLVYLLKGSLPWIEQSLRTAGLTKERIAAEELCSGLPQELNKYFRYVRGLGYSERPDYSKLAGYLETALKKAGHRNDNIFEWNK